MSEHPFFNSHLHRASVFCSIHHHLSSVDAAAATRGPLGPVAHWVAPIVHRRRVWHQLSLAASQAQMKSFVCSPAARLLMRSEGCSANSGSCSVDEIQVSRQEKYLLPFYCNFNLMLELWNMLQSAIYSEIQSNLNQQNSFTGSADKKDTEVRAGNENIIRF